MPPKPKSRSAPKASPKSNPRPHNAPVSQSITLRQSAPQFLHSASPGGIRVRHTELVSLLATSSDPTTFFVRWFQLNPAVRGSFPWLSSVANNFEVYRFHDLSIKLTSRVPTSQPGVLAVAFDRDPLDATPASYQEMMTMSPSARASIWDHLSLRIPKEMLHTLPWYFTRDGSTAPADLKTYDPGQYYVATEGTTGLYHGVEVQVTYDVEFKTPQQSPASTTSRAVQFHSAGISEAPYINLSPAVTPTRANGQLLLGPPGQVGAQSRPGWAPLNWTTILEPGIYDYVLRGSFTPGTAVPEPSLVLEGMSLISSLIQVTNAGGLLTMFARFMTNTALNPEGLISNWLQPKVLISAARAGAPPGTAPSNFNTVQTLYMVFPLGQNAVLPPFPVIADAPMGSAIVIAGGENNWSPQPKDC